MSVDGEPTTGLPDSGGLESFRPSLKTGRTERL